MRDAGFHSHRAAKKGDGLAPSQSIDPHVPTGFEDRILLKLANRGRGVLGPRSALRRAGSHSLCPLLKVDRPCHRAAVGSHFDPADIEGTEIPRGAAVFRRTV